MVSFVNSVGTAAGVTQSNYALEIYVDKRKKCQNLKQKFNSLQ